MRLLIAVRLFGSWPSPASSNRVMGASTTFGASNFSSEEPPALMTRAGWYSNHACIAATFSDCLGSDSGPYFTKLCQPCQENSWLSHIATNGRYARASWMSDNHEFSWQGWQSFVKYG